MPDLLLEQLRATLSDRFRLERELGRGGMAAVYFAHDLARSRDVAIKVLHADASGTSSAERFQREIQLASQLTHPHILAVLESGEDDGLLWYAMEFAEGETLRQRLKREPQLPIGEALRIMRGVADALEFAHGKGTIHRDIKPENIMLSGDRILVMDFGIARAIGDEGTRITATGTSVGTPAYMSPEQAAGERMLDARSDIYSLGSVLYEMLAGEPPFTGPNAKVVIAKRLTQAPPSVCAIRDTVSPEVDDAIRKSLALVPAQRFASVREFADALARPSMERPVPAGSVRRRRTARWQRAATLVIVAALIAALAWYLAIRWLAAR